MLPSPRTARLLLIQLCMAFALMGAGRAHAQSRSDQARDAYDRGIVQYNLGRFAQAIEHFERAYELRPDPILLFNIAQAHRQNDNLEQAIFFYKRYLASAPKAPNHADVQKRIAELEDLLDKQKALKQKPPTGVSAGGQDAGDPPAQVTTTSTPTTSASSGATSGSGLTPASASGTLVAQRVDTAEPVAPRLDSAPAVKKTAAPASAEEVPYGQIDLALGPGFMTFGGDELGSTSVFVLRVSASLSPVLVPPFLSLGLTATLTPVGYNRLSGLGEATSFLTGIYAHVTAWNRFHGTPWWLGGQLGVGMMWWGGVDGDNPFTRTGAGFTAPIPMVSATLLGTVAYRLPYDLLLTASPGLTYSGGGDSGLKESAQSMMRYDLLIGAAYTFY